jgi:hypothetical protein
MLVDPEKPHRRYLQHIPISAERVCDGEWIRPIAIAHAKPALEIDAPNLIGRSNIAEMAHWRV